MRPWPILAMILCSSALAFNKDFKLHKDRAPLEFELMFDSLKNSLKGNESQLRLMTIAQHINKGLGPLKKDQVLFLLKSESYKTLLEWPNPPSQFPITPRILERLKSSIANGGAIYTPYSLWILQALAADLEIYQKAGLLTATPLDTGSLSAEKREQYQRMQRLLKYARAWYELADVLSPQDFNLITGEVAWKTLEGVRDRALLFQRFASKAIEDTYTETFNIPEQGMPRKASAPAQVKAEPGTTSVTEKAQQEKAEAQSQMEQLKPTSSTLPPEELSGAIDGLTEDLPPSGGTAPSKESSPLE